MEHFTFTKQIFRGKTDFLCRNSKNYVAKTLIFFNSLNPKVAII